MRRLFRAFLALACAASFGCGRPSGDGDSTRSTPLLDDPTPEAAPVERKPVDSGMSYDAESHSFFLQAAGLTEVWVDDTGACGTETTPPCDGSLEAPYRRLEQAMAAIAAPALPSTIYVRPGVYNLSPSTVVLPNLLTISASASATIFASAACAFGAPQFFIASGSSVRFQGATLYLSLTGCVGLKNEGNLELARTVILKHASAPGPAVLSSGPLVADEVMMQGYSAGPGSVGIEASSTLTVNGGLIYNFDKGVVARGPATIRRTLLQANGTGIEALGLTAVISDAGLISNTLGVYARQGSVRLVRNVMRANQKAVYADDTSRFGLYGNVISEGGIAVNVVGTATLVANELRDGEVGLEASQESAGQLPSIFSGANNITGHARMGVQGTHWQAGPFAPVSLALAGVLRGNHLASNNGDLSVDLSAGFHYRPMPFDENGDGIVDGVRPGLQCGVLTNCPSWSTVGAWNQFALVSEYASPRQDPVNLLRPDDEGDCRHLKGDADHDSWCTAEEEIFGTDPASAASYPRGSEAPCPGDLNNDGKVSLADATLATPLISANATLATHAGRREFHRADINGDGAITLADAVSLSPAFATGTCAAH